MSMLAPRVAFSNSTDTASVCLVCCMEGGCVEKYYDVVVSFVSEIILCCEIYNKVSCNY